MRASNVNTIAIWDLDLVEPVSVAYGAQTTWRLEVISES